MKIACALPSVFVVAALLAGCQQGNEEAASAPTSTAPSGASSASTAEAKLTPLPGKEGTVPALTQVTTVRFATTAGDVVIEVYPQAAPNAAQRFIELARSGFFDDTPISRVVPGFVAQFGINWREPHKQWEHREFIDDPSLFALERGTLAFAKSGRPVCGPILSLRVKEGGTPQSSCRSNDTRFQG